jgi:dienelactone hydrolase
MRGIVGAVTAAMCIAAAARAEEFDETVVMIPKPASGFTVHLETTIFKPRGNGPFPIAVFNHERSKLNAHEQPRARSPRTVRFFIQRGYVVIAPMRQGFSKSTGVYIGIGCNIEENGLIQAEDVRAALDYVASQPYADRNRIVVLGHYHGGWTTLAFGTFNYPGLKGLVNFSGGLKQPRCAAWEGTLARAAGSYAKVTRVPSLWFYGDNEDDPLYSPELLRRMHAAYTAAGGRARLVPFEKVSHGEGHLFYTRANQRIWQAELAKFLEDIDLPHRVVNKPASH